MSGHQRTPSPLDAKRERTGGRQLESHAGRPGVPLAVGTARAQPAADAAHGVEAGITAAKQRRIEPQPEPSFTRAGAREHQAAQVSCEDPER